VDLDIGTFLTLLTTNPMMTLVVILSITIIIVNGATDAPNAISTVVSTRALKPRVAILMAACCNFIGLIVVSLFNTAVANTIFNMVDFGGDTHTALVAVLAALVAIIVWGVAAWYFGLPASQSHSLIAGLTGAAIALQGGLAGVNGAEWAKVIYGILLSTFMGFGLGWLGAKGIQFWFGNKHRRSADTGFRRTQIATSAAAAFMHGAQDGQKFLSIMILAMALSLGHDVSSPADLAGMPAWLMLLVALCMGSGTAIGGERIIKNVGMNMTKLEPYQGCAASAGSVICLVAATLSGMPVSTTHANTTAIMGVGAARNPKLVKWSLAKDMVLTWILTFPGCGFMGWLFAELFFMVL
jgi:inorganic phosphate transporter, PiT family